MCHVTEQQWPFNYINEHLLVRENVVARKKRYHENICCLWRHMWFFFAWSDAKATMYIFVTKILYFKLNWKPDMCAHVRHHQHFFLICSWYSRQLFSFVYDRSQIVIDRATVKLWRPCSQRSFWGMNTSELGYTLFLNNLINNIFSWSCWPKANLSLTFYL